jgi:chromatin remodeling complex protein RSC6
VLQIEALTKEVESQLTNLENIKKSLKSLANECKKKLKDRKPRVEKPVKITSELSKLLDYDKEKTYTKSAVISAVAEYIRNKKLQNESNKKEFTLDNKLKKLFDTEEEKLQMINISKYITKHLIRE